MTEPRFKPGDRVAIVGGRGNIWRVVREDTGWWDDETAYILEHDNKRRAAAESALRPVSAAAAARAAWQEVKTIT